MEIEHQKSSLNVVPDALSRAPLEVNVIEVARTDNQHDNWYLKMLDQVNKSPEKFPDWRIDGGILYKHVPLSYGFRSNFPECKVIVPKSKRLEVLKSCHDDP
ncbi:hypothetical protein JTB14_002180 [Gonioctena quinquepunctata]|nr:hypothetical protein JTB14_002180 [Gonioctena quinquepunctata]